MLGRAVAELPALAKERHMLIYTPNRIPRGERIWNTVFAGLLFA